MVRVRCSHCPQVYQVPKERLGMQATCKKCQHTFTLEMAADETGIQRAKPLSTPSTSSAARAMPRKLGQYLLKHKLGAGAMGEVWLARDPALERDAAIKLMAPGIASDPERRQRFEREAKTAAKLLHTNTVAVYSFGVEGEHAYLAMELVDGSSLDRIVSEQGPLPWREATRAICDAARGLAAAHDLGLVHRDVKPANLMRTAKGVTKVVDFGLARAALSDTQLTQEGTLLGTPAYMAPEQWMGGEVDARSDLYSLICTYYYLLTAHLPFDAPSLPALGYQHRYEPFPDPRQIAADLPDGVCRILARGAQKEQSQRYQSADELVAELESLMATPREGEAPAESLAFAADFSLPALVVTRRTAKRGPRGMNPLVWIAAAGGGAALLLGVIIYVATNHGTIKIELSDPSANVEVKVDGDRVELAGLDEPLRLAAREHELVVKGENFETATKKFTVKRGGNPALTIELVPRPAVADFLPGQPPPLAIAPPAPQVSPPPAPAPAVVTTPATVPPPSVPTVPPANASASGVPADARQLRGNSYKFFAEKLSWKEAKAKCEASGGHLVTIESAEEQKFVSDLVAATAWQDAWIGITDEVSEGTWMTVTGRPVGYSNWFVNQPNNKAAAEHFALMSSRASGYNIDWRWCDQPDRALDPHQPGYVCEWEPTASIPPTVAPPSNPNELVYDFSDPRQFDDFESQVGQWEVRDGVLTGVGGKEQNATLRLKRKLAGPIVVSWDQTLQITPEIGQFGEQKGGITLSNATRGGLHYDSSYHAGGGFGPGGKGLQKELQIFAGYSPRPGQGAYGPIGQARSRGGPMEFDKTYRLQMSVAYPSGRTAVRLEGAGWNLVNGRIDDIKPEYLRLWTRNCRVRFDNLRITSEATNVPVVAPQPASPQAAAEWTQLFNGKDLSGWTTHPNQPGGWTVENGAIVGRSSDANHLFCERAVYSNFHLRAEVKLNDRGNSGVYFRGNFGVERNGRYPDAYEAQIVNENPSIPLTGSLRMHGGKGNDPTYTPTTIRPDEWFTLEIIADGKHLTIKINDRVTTDVLDSANLYNIGHIALQTMVGVGGAPTVVNFRKIEIKELPARSAAASAPSPVTAPASAPAVTRASPASKSVNQWVSLFNGKDTTGWKSHPDDNSKWEVRNGWLMCTGLRGHLFTERDDYENFHFRVEARINNIGNSGQYFRVAYGPDFPKGYEAQISTAQGDQKTGSLYNFVKIPQQLHRPDEWFTQEVIANGNRIIILVNGRKVVDFRDPANTYTKGHLALQQNGAATVMFRKIEVKELKSP